MIVDKRISANLADLTVAEVNVIREGLYLVIVGEAFNADQKALANALVESLKGVQP